MNRDLCWHTLEFKEMTIIILSKTRVHVMKNMLSREEDPPANHKYIRKIPHREATYETVAMNSPMKQLRLYMDIG